jgi:hypothetical protein
MGIVPTRDALDASGLDVSDADLDVRYPSTRRRGGTRRR